MMLKKNNIITIIGRKGTGKSLYIKKKIIKNVKRLILIDALDEYDELPKINDIYDLSYYTENPIFKIRYIPNNIDDYINFISTLWELRKKINNYYLIIDETSFWQSRNLIDDYTANFIKFGRHYAISFVAVCRRPFEINRLITSQSDEFIIFNVIEPRDLEYLRLFSINTELKLDRLEYIRYDVINNIISKNKLKIED